VFLIFIATSGQKPTSFSSRKIKSLKNEPISIKRVIFAQDLILKYQFFFSTDFWKFLQTPIFVLQKTVSAKQHAS
jgi:hypothetical protein